MQSGNSDDQVTEYDRLIRRITDLEALLALRRNQITEANALVRECKNNIENLKNEISWKLS